MKRWIEEKRKQGNQERDMKMERLQLII